MSDAFEAGWMEIIKAQPCPLCGVKGGGTCQGKGGSGPASRCKQRRKAVESGITPTEDAATVAAGIEEPGDIPELEQKR